MKNKDDGGHNAKLQASNWWTTNITVGLNQLVFLYLFILWCIQVSMDVQVHIIPFSQQEC